MTEINCFGGEIMQEWFNLGVDAVIVLWGLKWLLMIAFVLVSLIGSAFCKDGFEFKGFMDRLFPPIEKLEKFLVSIALIILTVLVVMRAIMYFS